MAKPARGKKIMAMVKLQITAGKATPAPPVGPALGQHGANFSISSLAPESKTSSANSRGT